MDVKLKYFNVNCQKRARRSLKPWWNQNLKTLFDDFASSEKYTLNASVDSIKPNFLMNLNISVNCLTENIGKQNETSFMKKKLVYLSLKPKISLNFGVN